MESTSPISISEEVSIESSDCKVDETNLTKQEEDNLLCDKDEIETKEKENKSKEESKEETTVVTKLKVPNQTPDNPIITNQML